MKTIAVIASLDTKLEETEYTTQILQNMGFGTYVIDISTKTLIEKKSADITPNEILEMYGISWKQFDEYDKGKSIDTMCKAIEQVVPQLYQKQLFDGVISIGGGQNARMAAYALKALPFGVPKVLASSLACGKRTMEQYVGCKDIFVMHTVADISGLNTITKTVIQNVCAAIGGLVTHTKTFEKAMTTKVIGTTMLGITSKGIERVKKDLEKEGYEVVVFHANGVGGRCMENLIQTDKLDVILDATLHEITCEILGGYCAGANNRLKIGVESKKPMIVVPGALDMVDFFVDEQGMGLPEDIDERKKVFHNSSICHCKIYPKEAQRLAETVAERLNQAKVPITIVIPTQGCCEAAAPGGAMYDPETDRVLVETFKDKIISPLVKVVIVEANINDEKFSEVVRDEVLKLV